MTPTTKIPLGVYVGNTDASSATGSATFESGYDSFVASMGTAPTYLDTFLDQTIPISQWASGAAWQAWSNAQLPDSKNLIPIISLPMASTAIGALTADQTYQAFASGAYDSVITGMVQAWAAKGFTTQIWRPGWEMNLASVPWYAGSDAKTQADWVAAFQRISTVLHAAGQQYGVDVQVMWNPDTTSYSNANATADLYPGNSYVDIIGADDYANVSPYTLYDFGTHAGTTDATLAQWMADPANLEHYWTDPAATQYATDASQGHSLSLDDLLQFAEQEGKPFGVAETGSGDSASGHDVTDDAAFPQWLSAQLTTAEAAGETIDFVNIWDTDDAGNFQFSQTADDKPLEAAAWRAAFGATATSETAAITTDDVTITPIAGGTSSVTGDENDLVTTPSDEASLVVLGAGRDTVFSNGTDTIIGGTGSATVTASANALIFARGTLSFTNGAGSSTIIGGGATDVLGGAGGVVVYGGPGNDDLVGGSANHNVLVAGAGNATLRGGGNGDLLVAGAIGQDSITAAGSAAIFAAGASDTVQGGTGPITTIGGTGSLTITQSAAGNAVFAGPGTTTINDSSGLDYVIAGSGLVTIDQAAAEEVLYIGSGSMVLNAGSGMALIGLFAGAAGGTLTINGYQPSLDFIYPSGYATAPTTTTDPAGTTLAFADGTRILLPGIASH